MEDLSCPRPAPGACVGSPVYQGQEGDPFRDWAFHQHWLGGTWDLISC